MKVIKKIIYWIGLVLLWVIAAGVATNFVVEKDQAISAAITVIVAIVMHLFWRKILGVKKKPKKTVADDKKVAPEEPVSAIAATPPPSSDTGTVESAEPSGASITSIHEEFTKKNIVRLTVISTGGEFTGGVITDQHVKEKLREKIDEGSVNSSMEFDDGTSFEAYEYTSILQNHGPNVPGSTILVEESNDIDKDEDDRVYEEISSTDIDETEITQFTSSNPDPDDPEFVDKSNYSEDDLIFYSQKIEKRIHYPVLIEIDDEEEFELSNVYIGSMNMDETISGDEIIKDVLYISKNKAIEYSKEYLQDQYDADLLSDYLTDIYLEAPELREKIINNHRIDSGDVEGKGEWENDYVKITDMNGEVLFEDGQY